MKKSFKRFLSLVLPAVLMISLLLCGCEKKTDDPKTPVAPPVQGEQTTPVDTEVQGEPTTPTSPAERPDASTEEGTFVKDGKVYITDCVFIGLEGTLDGYGWTSWSGKTYLAGQELVNYKRSEDVYASSIKQALDRAFKPIITSHPDCQDGYTIYNLKNNDVVTWTYEIDEEMFDKLKSYVTGIEFVVTDGEMVIDTLISSMEVNPFEEPGFFGIDYYDDENGERVWLFRITDLREDVGVELEVEIDTMGHTGEWNNGDQIKVTILTSAEQLGEYGYVFTQTEGIITIDWM
jgi:hypothetical protein